MTDAAIDLTNARGEDYGHPADQFPLTEGMYAMWRAGAELARLTQGEPTKATETVREAMPHAAHMILTKLSRACTNPLHRDSWDDIKGYAHTMLMVLERAEVIPDAGVAPNQPTTPDPLRLEEAQVEALARRAFRQIQEAAQQQQPTQGLPINKRYLIDTIKETIDRALKTANGR